MRVLEGDQFIEFKEYLRRYPDQFFYLIVDERGSDITSDEFEDITDAVMEARDNSDAFGIVTRHYIQKENGPDYDYVLIWKNPNYVDTTDLSESKKDFIKVIDTGYDNYPLNIYPKYHPLYKEYRKIANDIGVDFYDVDYFIDNSAIGAEQIVILDDGSAYGVCYGNGSYSQMHYDEDDIKEFRRIIHAAESNFNNEGEKIDLSEAQTNYHKHVGKVNKEQLDRVIDNFESDIIYELGKEIKINKWRNHWKDEGVVCLLGLQRDNLTSDDESIIDTIIKKVCKNNGYRFFSPRWSRENLEFSIRIPYNKLETNKLDVKKDKSGKDIDISEEINMNEAVKDEEFYRNQAEELLKNSNSYAVIYGYMNNGNFYPLPELRKCRDNSELAAHTEAVELRYHPHGSIRVVYNRNINESVNSCDTKGNLYKSLDENFFSDEVYDPKVRG